MRIRKRLPVLAGIAGLLGFASLWLFAARPVPDVQLRASFLPELTDGTPCAYLNDALGPYVTYKAAVSVYFSGDPGDLHFIFDHHSNRSMGLIFPNFGNECGWLPDTTGLYPDVPDEPIDFLKFRTYNSDAFAPPKVNFLTMPVNTPTPVRLWTTICTTERHYFFMNFSQDVGKITGVIEVIAYDTVGNDGKADKWDLHPVPGTANMAKVYKHPETGDDSINCLFGEFPMPFHLILEKR
jgi:hypothetical protein